MVELDAAVGGALGASGGGRRRGGLVGGSGRGRRWLWSMEKLRGGLAWVHGPGPWPLGGEC